MNKKSGTVEEVLEELKDTTTVKIFLHCAQCIQEMPSGTSPREWARTEVGVTSQGVLVWCMRHQRAIVHMTPKELERVSGHTPPCHHPGHHHD